jgi:hypothetical protein
VGGSGQAERSRAAVHHPGEHLRQFEDHTSLSEDPSASRPRRDAP